MDYAYIHIYNYLYEYYFLSYYFCIMFLPSKLIINALERSFYRNKNFNSELTKRQNFVTFVHVFSQSLI